MHATFDVGITVQPKGRRRDMAPERDRPPVLSILVEADRIHVGIANALVEGFPDQIAYRDGHHDWARLRTLLVGLRDDDTLDERTSVEVAAESRNDAPVRYDDLVTIMDSAVAAGFGNVGITEPTSLSWRPSL